MTRRVGFGDEPSGGGGLPWATLLALAALLITIALVLDPGLADRALRWAFGSNERAGLSPSLLLGVAGVLAGAWVLTRVLSARSAARSAEAKDMTPPVRGRGAPERARAPRMARERPERANTINRRGTRTASDAARPVAGRRAGGCFAIVFLIVWLVGWTAGIVVVSGAFLNGFFADAGGAEWFMLIWIAFAVVGWFFAARLLLSLIRDAVGGGGDA